MIKYCCFIWTQGPILKPAIFWPKFGSDEDWVCQLLIEYVSDKSPVRKEPDYASSWRKGVVALCPLKTGVGETKEGEEENKHWDPLACLPPPYNLGRAPPSRP